MKTRIGYVSNSSSSSYIILYNYNDPIKFKDFEWSVDDFLDLVENMSRDWNSECTQVKSIGKESTINYIYDRYGYSDDGFVKELEDIINKSKKDSAACVNIAYSDQITKKMFDFLKSRKKLKIVNEWD